MNLNYEPERIYSVDQNHKVVAEVTFPEIRDGIVDINHTFVDDSLRGQGVASRLLEETAKILRTEGKRAVLTCSYAKSWFARHKEFSDILVSDNPANADQLER
ncbi:MAG: N-acetyltransferase domain-containing protein [Oscillospiraceae bacterium]|jgi:uncharacterized protein